MNPLVKVALYLLITLVICWVIDLGSLFLSIVTAKKSVFISSIFLAVTTAFGFITSIVYKALILDVVLVVINYFIRFIT